MVTRPSVLCPIDFSDASRGALRYAAALAEHFYGTLYVLTVDDPFLVQAATASLGTAALKRMTEESQQAFIKATFPGRTPQVGELKLLIRIGDPATQILRAVKATGADAVVMSTHGASGVRKLLFGSTTERVLRETQKPVLVTPGSDPGPESVEDWTRGARTILVPVDLSEFSLSQLRVAQGLAENVGAHLVVAHVLEPLPAREYFRHLAAEVDTARRTDAKTRLDQMLQAIPSRLSRTTEIVIGDPATEIARLSRGYGASVVVMALHASASQKRRIGSVTYRVLCQAPAVTLALPPARVVTVPVTSRQPEQVAMAPPSTR
jgi:universal stress protein A